MYNKDSFLILGREKDISKIAPTMVGDVVEEIEYQEVEIAPDNYFVGGKIVKLKECETIKNGKIVFNRDKKIEEIKKELSKLKYEYVEKEFIFQEKYLQKNRDVDKSNLTSIVVMLNATKQTEFKNWKFKDLNNVDVYVDITIADMLNMANTMQSQTTKALITESTLIAKLERLTVEELKTFDAYKEFENLWNK